MSAGFNAFFESIADNARHSLWYFNVVPLSAIKIGVAS
jgi:hypothetical protein